MKPKKSLTDQVTVDLNCFLMCLLTHQSLSPSK